MPRPATITHPRDETPTARLVEVSRSMKIHVELGLHNGIIPPKAFACAQPESGYEIILKTTVLVFADPVMFPSQEEIRRFWDLGYCSLGRETEDLCHHCSSGLPSQPSTDAASCKENCEEWAKQISDAICLFQCMPRGQRNSKVLVVKC